MPPSPPSPTAPPLTRLGMKAAGRVIDGRADFVVGEVDNLYAYLRAASGAYTITGVTFQVKQNNFGILEPNGTVDYSDPLDIIAYSLAEAVEVSTTASLDTTDMLPGVYDAEFVLSVTTSDDEEQVITVTCPIYLKAA